jgi:hypothetical protein
MSFASPLFLLGLAALAVPLLVHLIGRQRAPRRRFAALDFVLRCNRRVAQRIRLRQLLLLLTRMLVVAGLAVMLAKPFSETESDLPALGGRDQSAVLIIDDTLSLRRRVKGKPLFLLLQQRALDLVTHLGGRADVAVLSASQPGGPLPALTRDARKVRSAISALGATQRHASTEAALASASRILEGSSLPERHIFVLSDFAKHGWDTKLRAPTGQRLHLVDLARDLEPRNRAIVELSAAPSEAPGPRATRILARVCNYGSKPAQLDLTLSIDEKAMARGLLSLGPWSCGDKAFQHTFARGGLFAASVSLEPDELPEDDTRYLMVEVESPIRVLLVNGEPSPIRHRDEFFYLEAALQRPGVRGQPIVTRSVPISEPGALHLEGYDVVVLGNVGDLPPAQRVELDTFVRKGGGLLITVGENVEAERFNRALGELLPQELRGPTSAAAPGSGEALLRFGRVETDHPVLSGIWSEADGAGLRSARFERIYRLSPTARADRKVILFYDDGSPALLESRREQGRVLLFTSTVDRDWTDLPIRPGYLPLVQQLVRYLSRVPLQAPRRSLEVGDRARIKPPPGVRQLRLVGPAGIDRVWSAARLAERHEADFLITEPGIHQLSAIGRDGVSHPLERESFAANIDPRESDLRREVFASGLSAGGVRAKRRVELWHGLGALLLFFLLCEALLVRRG